MLNASEIILTKPTVFTCTFNWHTEYVCNLTIEPMVNDLGTNDLTIYYTGVNVIIVNLRDMMFFLNVHSNESWING